MARLCTKCKTNTDDFSPSSKYHCRACVRQRVAEWRKQNPEKYEAQLSRRDVEAIRRNNREWAKRNRDYTRASNLNRRARYYNAEGRIGRNTMEQLISLYGNKCLSCGSTEELQIDHVNPLSLGGSNLLENLQIICEPCNKSKNATFRDFRSNTSG